MSAREREQTTLWEWRNYLCRGWVPLQGGTICAVAECRCREELSVPWLSAVAGRNYLCRGWVPLQGGTICAVAECRCREELSVPWLSAVAGRNYLCRGWVPLQTRHEWSIDSRAIPPWLALHFCQLVTLKYHLLITYYFSATHLLSVARA